MKHLNARPEQKILDKLDELIAMVSIDKYQTYLKINAQLWKTSDVAAYLEVSDKYVSEYIVTHHNFPAPLRLPTKTGKNNGHPRWYKQEVLAWVKKYR